MNMILLENLSIGYDKIQVREGITAQIPKGSCVLLAGANGSGKSTLLGTIAGEISPLSGKVLVEGKCAMVPSRVPKVKGFTVVDFITTGMYSCSSLFGRLDKSLQGNLERAMDLLGISHLRDKDISQISDGEFQKASLATALVKEADVILLDEPTAFLDVEGRISVLSMLSGLAKDSGKTILFSSHDVLDGAKYSDMVLALLPDKATEISDMTMTKKFLLLQKCFPKLEINI